MFVGKLTDFGPKWNLSTGYFSATNAPILGLNFRIKPLEVWIVQVIKMKQKYNQFWICGSCRLGQGWGGGEKSQEHSPISNIFIYNQFHKTTWMQKPLVLKTWSRKTWIKFCGGNVCFTILFVEILFCKGSVLFLNRWTSRVIFPNFREENYRIIGNLSVTNHCIPTISIAQNKYLDVRNILEHWYETNLPDVLKLHASEVGSEIRKYP